MTTPFGLPVVPDVNTTSLGSSGPSAASRVSTSCAETASSAVEERIPGELFTVSVTGARGTGQQHRVREFRQLDAGFGEERGIVGVEEPADGEQHAGVAAGEDVRGFGTAEARVHRNEDPARGRDAERGDDPLERVRRPHRDPFAGRDAAADECARGVGDRLGQVGEADAPVTVDHRVRVAEAARAHLAPSQGSSAR